MHLDRAPEAVDQPESYSHCETCVMLFLGEVCLHRHSSIFSERTCMILSLFLVALDVLHAVSTFKDLRHSQDNTISHMNATRTCQQSTKAPALPAQPTNLGAVIVGMVEVS